MTDDELKALVASLAVAQQKTDEQLKETEYPSGSTRSSIIQK